MKDWFVNIIAVCIAVCLFSVAMVRTQEPIPDPNQSVVIVETVDAEIVQRVLAMIGDDSEFMRERNAILKRLNELERMKPPAENQLRGPDCGAGGINDHP